MRAGGAVGARENASSFVSASVSATFPSLSWLIAFGVPYDNSTKCCCFSLQGNATTVDAVETTFKTAVESGCPALIDG
jgi:hypothetical protein